MSSKADDEGSALVSEYSSLSVSWPIYLEFQSENGVVTSIVLPCHVGMMMIGQR